MHITFSPIRHDGTLSLARQGDALIVNGEAFDFVPLPEGGSLPAAAIASPWFAGPVQRLDGVLHLTLILPHGMPAPETTRFPAPLCIAGNGPVALPPPHLGRERMNIDFAQVVTAATLAAERLAGARAVAR